MQIRKIFLLFYNSYGGAILLWLMKSRFGIETKIAKSFDKVNQDFSACGALLILFKNNFLPLSTKMFNFKIGLKVIKSFWKSPEGK